MKLRGAVTVDALISNLCCSGDLETLRAMVKRAFPRLTLRAPAVYNDNSPTRFDWDGANDEPPPPNLETVFWTALRSAGDAGLTGAELMAATGMSTTWVYKRLKDNERARRVARTSPPGRWRTTDPAARAISPPAPIAPER